MVIQVERMSQHFFNVFLHATCSFKHADTADRLYLSVNDTCIYQQQKITLKIKFPILGFYLRNI